MKIILASKSGVRKKILMKNNIICDVIHSNVDEDQVKESLIEKGADAEMVSKNLAELKSVKVSNSNPDRLVLGADSVVALKNELINKPIKNITFRFKAFKLLYQVFLFLFFYLSYKINLFLLLRPNQFLW